MSDRPFVLLGGGAASVLLGLGGLGLGLGGVAGCMTAIGTGSVVLGLYEAYRAGEKDPPSDDAVWWLLILLFILLVVWIPAETVKKGVRK